VFIQEIKAGYLKIVTKFVYEHIAYIELLKYTDS